MLVHFNDDTYKYKIAMTHTEWSYERRSTYHMHRILPSTELFHGASKTSWSVLDRFFTGIDINNSSLV